MKTCLYRYIATVLDKPEASIMGHNAEWNSWTIADIIRGMGYHIHALDWKRSGLDKIRGTFDLVFDVICLPDLLPFCRPDTVKVFMLTGSDNVKRNERGEWRTAELNKRRGCNLPYYRRIPEPEKVYKSIEAADYVVMVGNQKNLHEYPEKYWEKIHLTNVTSSNVWRFV